MVAPLDSLLYIIYSYLKDILKKITFNIKLLKNALKKEKEIRIFVLIEIRTMIIKEKKIENNISINFNISLSIIPIKK